MSQNNPLQKYHRQPKIFISLPSKGLYYEVGTLLGDYNNVPIYALSGMDEIILKTPDALFSGTATAKVIESCCPYIKDAQKIPAIDVDALIIAIRIATYGDKLVIDKICKHCEADNTYEIPLQPVLDKFNHSTFQNTIQVTNDIQIKLRPLTYFEMSHYSIENFKLQKTLSQIEDLPEEQRQEQIDQIFRDLADLQLDLFVTMIETVIVPEQAVTDKETIAQWLRNSERSVFQYIKTKIDTNRNEWTIPNQSITCASCNAEDSVEIVLDYSSFFV
jgi:hypothetical protein